MLVIRGPMIWRNPGVLIFRWELLIPVSEEQDGFFPEEREPRLSQFQVVLIIIRV